MNVPPTTLPVTIADDTRHIAVQQVWADNFSRLDSKELCGLYRKGHGKTWKGRIYFWLQKDGSYQAGRHGTFLNRGGYTLVGFADSAATSEHNSAR